MNTVWLFIVSGICGIAIILQGQFMGLMDQRLGTRESVFITYASGAVAAALIMLPKGWHNLKACGDLPAYVYTSGVLGLIIIGAIGYVVPRWGSAKAFTLIVASQFVAAALVDHFGLFGAVVRPLTMSRTLGLGVILTGVWMAVR